VVTSAGSTGSRVSFAGRTIGSQLDAEEEAMAVAFIQEFPITDRGTSNYDAVNGTTTP
jgi:hypothetical protein